MVKAPRDMRRKQEIFGTNRRLVASPAARIAALKNLQPNLVVAGDARLRVAAGIRDEAGLTFLTTISCLKLQQIILTQFLCCCYLKIKVYLFCSSSLIIPSQQ